MKKMSKLLKLLSVCLLPAFINTSYIYNTVGNCCVSAAGLWNVTPFSHAINNVHLVTKMLWSLSLINYDLIKQPEMGDQI